MAAEVAISTTACTKLPNDQDVQLLSDGYDDLVNPSKGMANEFQKLESILNTIQSRVTSNAKAIDDTMTYSFQYNIKIIGVPQATDSKSAGKTANICLFYFTRIRQT